jgi:hypothetical protein
LLSIEDMQIRDLLRILYGSLVGSLLYILLVFLPLAGPLYAGIFAGRKARTMPITGFFVGVSSAVLGYLAWVYVIFPFFNIRTEDFIAGIFWILFLAWNIFCALLAGIGGILGSILAYSENMLSSSHNNRRKKDFVESPGKNAPEPHVPTFVICPSCGTSNQEDSTHCKNCGKDIR